MSAKNFAPPLRIEARELNAENVGPWSIFDLAQTETQAENKTKKAKTAAPELEFRTVPNVPDERAATVYQDTPETTRALETLGNDNMKLRREIAALTLDLEKFRKAAAPAVDSIAGPTPLPFGVGAKLKDTHSGAIVTVTAINPPHPRSGDPRPGFAYSADLGVTGFVPVNSVGSYVPA